MTTTPLDPRSRVLDAAKDAVAARRRADVDLLVAAAEWAVQHPATEATDYAGFGEDLLFGEALTPLAGQGAPLVAEFAPAELAAVLGWSTETVKELMGDALELRYRLPRVWRLVQALRLPVPLARYLAEQTHDLDAYTANAADKMLACCDPGKLTRRIGQTDHRRAAASTRTPTSAAADEENALAARKVEVRPGATPATTEVIMDLDTADAEAFDEAVALVAEALKDLGDTDDLDIRRARAVGVLADPRAALDLLHRSQTPDRKPGGGSATLFLHLDLATLADLAVHGTTGPVHDERRGTATTDLIRDWLTDWLGDDAKLTVQPYLDLNHPETITPVDGHDPTPAMVDARPAQRPCLRLPRLQETIPPLRPRPHRRLRPTRRRRTTRPDPPRQPRPTLPRTPPRQDPRPMVTTDASPTADTAGPHPPAAPSTYHRAAVHDAVASLLAQFGCRVDLSCVWGFQIGGNSSTSSLVALRVSITANRSMTLAVSTMSRARSSSDMNGHSAWRWRQSRGPGDMQSRPPGPGRCTARSSSASGDPRRSCRQPDRPNT